MAPYAEFIELIAAGVTPEQIISFKPSEQAQNRLDELLYRRKSDIITAEEKHELNHFKEIEHIMRLAKARARKYF